MLQLSSVTTMNRTRAPRAPRNSTSTPSRGGIRKRGAALRTDRDGDLDMDGGSSGRGRGGRGRGRGDRGQNDSGRGTPTSNHSQPRDSRRHGGDKDKTLDAIQKAIYSSQSSQANIRQPRGRIEELTRDTGSRDRNGLEQISVRGWKQSKAASNADGGIESLIAFMEKKGTPPDPNVAANLRVRITKVCATPISAGHRRIRSAAALSRLFSFQAKLQSVDRGFLNLSQIRSGGCSFKVVKPC